MSLECKVGLACDLCGECVEVCSSGALSITNSALKYNADNCQYCEVCCDVCPEYAIRIYKVEE